MMTTTPTKKKRKRRGGEKNKIQPSNHPHRTGKRPRHTYSHT